MDTAQTWPRASEAAAFFENQFHGFAARNARVADMAARFRDSAGVNILTLVDHWVLPASESAAQKLAECGLKEIVTEDGDLVWEHPLARLPRVRLQDALAAPKLALAVEDVAHFLQRNQISASIEGDPGSRYECASYSLGQGDLVVVARRGYRGFRPGSLSDSERKAIDDVQIAFRSRNRRGDDLSVIEQVSELAARAIESIGAGRAVDEFFAAEREYYMAKNDAAQWQYARQQELGLGWANHDHHTYRSSRESFRDLIRLWLAFGFTPRERYYAGADAGWGAQILEHPVSRVVIFADVDVAPQEIDIDFTSVQLPLRTVVGTIGLWCGLHGGSIAAAGMHHLECEFDFARVQACLQDAGFVVMAPFTDLPMLKQAFTLAENWVVDPAGVEALKAQGAITAEEASRFLTAGAAGSHLEILQRWDGFKGFNKTGVSAIIRDTDARRAA